MSSVGALSVGKILVAVDGSEHSKKAVELAADMGKKWGAEVYLIHVNEERHVPEGFKEYAKVERVESGRYFELVCRQDQFLGEAEARLKEAGIKTTAPICAFGDAADEIIKAAKTKEVDMIVMGSRGLGRFSVTVMGSVSNKVCNHAPCTCITVK